LNARLPEDLRVLRCSEAPTGFHPRTHARAKLYRYRVWNGADSNPLLRRCTHHVIGRLDLAAMRRGAEAFIGRHDFKSFETAGSDPGGTVRTLAALEISGTPGRELRFEAYGDGFLRHMVRILVGTLLEFGLGKRAPEEAAGVLAARDRAAAGPTAPAKGLVLVRIDYGIP
jgi:tRNA pseudouridine38-40 synthase